MYPRPYTTASTQTVPQRSANHFLGPDVSTLFSSPLAHDVSSASALGPHGFPGDHSVSTDFTFVDPLPPDCRGNVVTGGAFTANSRNVPLGAGICVRVDPRWAPISHRAMLNHHGTMKEILPPTACAVLLDNPSLLYSDQPFLPPPSEGSSSPSVATIATLSGSSTVTPSQPSTIPPKSDLSARSLESHACCAEVPRDFVRLEHLIHEDGNQIFRSITRVRVPDDDDSYLDLAQLRPSERHVLGLQLTAIEYQDGWDGEWYRVPGDGLIRLAEGQSLLRTRALDYNCHAPEVDAEPFRPPYVLFFDHISLWTRNT